MNIADLEREARERDLEALARYKAGTGAPPILYQAIGYLKAASDGNDGDVFVASEESEDRVGDLIAVEGVQLDSFRKNPVFMFMHDHRIAPIGQVSRIWVEGKQLLNTVAWDMEDAFAAFIAGKYARRVMRAESIGFRPIEFDDRESPKSGLFGSFNFTKIDLLEVSAVAVPAHPAALRKAMGEDRFTIIMPEAPKIVSPPPPGLSLADVSRILKALAEEKHE